MKQPTRSAARVELAGSIERLADARAAAGSLDQVILETKEKLWAAQSIADATDARIAAAVELSAAHAVSVALGRGGTPPQTVQAARAEVIAAADEVSTIKATLAALEAMTGERAQQVRWRTIDVGKQAEQVVKFEPAIVSMLARHAELRDEFHRLDTALSFLAGSRLLPDDARFQRIDQQTPRGDAPFRAWLKELETNPDAVCPVTP